MQALAARPVSVGTRVQLFVDEYLIARSEGLAERLHPTQKHPQPVLVATAPWERPGRSGLAGWINAHYDTDEQRIKLWYYSRGTITAGGTPPRTSLPTVRHVPRRRAVRAPGTRPL